MSALGNSNLSNCSTSSSSTSAISSAAGKSSGKKKEARGLEKVPEKCGSSWADRSRIGGRGKYWSGDLRFRNQDLSTNLGQFGMFP